MSDCFLDANGIFIKSLLNKEFLLVYNLKLIQKVLDARPAQANAGGIVKTYVDQVSTAHNAAYEPFQSILPARVELGVNLAQPIARNMGVNLRSGNIGVTQQLLDNA